MRRGTWEKAFSFSNIPAKYYRLWDENVWVANAGYTPQDSWADFEQIYPLLTILGKVPIILVVQKIILSDFPVVWSMLRVTESAWKNVGGAPNKKPWCVWGTPRTPSYRSKMVKSTIFVPSCLWSLKFWRSYTIFKILLVCSQHYIYII